MSSRRSDRLLGFLGDRLDLAKDELPTASEWAGSGNTIGSLALRMGILSLEQIESVVDRQVGTETRFGQAAVALGYLTQAQVDKLVGMQEFHRCVDLAGPLVMEGQVEIADLARLLADFFEES